MEKLKFILLKLKIIIPDNIPKDLTWVGADDFQ